MYLRGFRIMGGCFGNSFYGRTWFMPLIMIVLTIAVVAATVLIIKRTNNSRRKNIYDTSIEELKIEFAKGNLTEEEYLRKKRILSE
jgi:putative membrane protein